MLVSIVFDNLIFVLDGFAQCGFLVLVSEGPRVT